MATISPDPIINTTTQEPSTTTQEPSETTHELSTSTQEPSKTLRTPSTTVYTSVVTKSASGTGASASPVVITVTATSVSDPSGTTSNEGPLVATITTSRYTATVTFGDSSAEGNTGGGMDDTTKIALGVSIPLGIIVLGMLIAGAYFWGKRASQASGAAGSVDILSDKDNQKRGAETHELPSESIRQELPTHFNLTEMSALDGPREMAARSPVELPSNENDR